MPASATVPLSPRGLELGTARPEILFRRCRREGDSAAREALVLRFMPLARKLARRYAHTSVPYEDLVQVASLALVKAVDRFDPARGTAFRTFAIPTILGELKRYFRDSAWAVHVTRGAQERALEIEEANEELINRLGRSPTVQEIAGALELSQEEVLDGLRAAQAYTTMSLEAPPPSAEPGSEPSFESELGVDDERYELIEDEAVVADAMRELPESERRILRLRFIEDMTQNEIGARLGISQMQVSRVLRRVLARLQQRVGASA
jgi:RNA polymerase sigma-B factor